MEIHLPGGSEVWWEKLEKILEGWPQTELFASVN